ncbi:MAG: 7-cyano-7-deazaguanine synthase [Kiritimatiellae bacterium]|nr:7-cyano-7-deazaguanine synthase [Kiritimatiellia bacterium]
MKVAVGISGGVDSAVAALLLKEQGHEIVGVTMTLGRADEATSLAEAKAVAERLDIPLKVFDFSSVWHTQVFEYLRRVYLGGQTPNPCVRCNETVKFGLLPRAAFELGCERFATGHYARIECKHRVTETQSEVCGEAGVPRAEARRDGSSSVPLCLCVKNVRLLRAVDKAKDQSYFLYRVKPEILAKTVFPLGELTKEEVRAKARAFGLEVAEKGDSQDFCGGDPMKIVGAAPCEGNIVTVDGKVLGKHQGFWNYTIGKRRGLGIGGGTPYYVVGLNAARNEVIVGFKEASVVRRFKVDRVVSFASDEDAASPLQAAFPLMVKVRSAGEPKGPVIWNGETVACPDGIAGIAPGQSAVFFRGDEIVGGGIIRR